MISPQMSLEEERPSPVPCSVSGCPSPTAESASKSPVPESVNMGRTCGRVRTAFSSSWKKKEDESLPTKNAVFHQHPESFTTTNDADGEVVGNDLFKNLVGTPGRGDALLRWGKTKRCRVSRSDGRSAKARQEFKIPATEMVRVDTHQNHGPPATAGGCVLRPRTPVRDPLSRDVEEKPSMSNGCPSDTASRPICRRTDERVSGADNPPAACPPSGGQPSNSQQPGLSSLAPCSEPCVGTETKKRKFNVESFQWPTFCISLSRKEKQEDFLAIRGTKLPLRPKRRSKIVDRDLEYCFPGMWLCDMSRARYEVREKKCVKRRRGLKGLDSIDSDSE